MYNYKFLSKLYVNIDFYKLLYYYVLLAILYNFIYYFQIILFRLLILWKLSSS